MLKKLLYEPLIHFLLLGALLFSFYAFTQEGGDGENSIVISKERVAQLNSAWSKASLTLPGLEDKKQILDKEIYQRVLYKEAVKTGLDKFDNTIKGHLAQKMEALIFDTQDFDEPSEEALRAYMQTHADKYAEDVKVSFEQQMLDSSTSTFEKQYTLSSFEASNIFGRAFAEGLFYLKADGKTHKLESDYGVHEVQVTKKPVPKLKSFDSVKEKVKEDYLKAKREEKNKEIFEALKSHYSITIEEK